MDKAIPADESALRSFQGLLSASTRSELNAFIASLGQIGRIRAAVDSGAMSPLGAFQAYDGIIDAEYQFYNAGIQDKGASLTGDAVGASDGAYAVEMASREATLVAGALVDRGQLSAAARQLFISAVASRRVLIGQAHRLADARPPRGVPGRRQLTGLPAIPGHGRSDLGRRAAGRSR